MHHATTAPPRKSRAAGRRAGHERPDLRDGRPDTQHQDEQRLFAQPPHAPPARLDEDPLPALLQRRKRAVHPNLEHVHGHRQPDAGAAGVDLPRERDVLQQIVLRRGVAADSLVDAPLEQHELSVRERPPAVSPVHLVDRVHLHQRHRRDRLHDALVPRCGDDPRKERQESEAVAAQQSDRSPHERGIESNVGVREEQQSASGRLGADARRIALSGPVGRACRILDGPKARLALCERPHDLTRAVAATIQDDHDFELGIVAREEAGQAVRDDSLLVVGRDDDRHQRPAPDGGRLREAIAHLRRSRKRPDDAKRNESVEKCGQCAATDKNPRHIEAGRVHTG